MSSKKSQTAMEFLSTYGWAIVVFLIAIAALSYVGVLAPSKLVPESCILPAGFTCESFQVHQNGINLVIINNLDYDLSNSIAEAEFCGEPNPLFNRAVISGNKYHFDIWCSWDMAEKERYKGTIKITYTDPSGINHTINGELAANVERTGCKNGFTCYDANGNLGNILYKHSSLYGKCELLPYQDCTTPPTTQCKQTATDVTYDNGKTYWDWAVCA